MCSEQNNDFSRLGVKYELGENLGKYTSYGLGGNCEVMFFPKTQQEFKKCLTLRENHPVFILGNGTDVLVSDSGYKGVVINTSLLNRITVKGSLIVAECGVKTSELIKTACENSLSGLEFAVGVPAFVGGAVCMNAGCFNKSVSEYVSFVKGERGVYNNADCNFAYRSSRFFDEAIFEVGFILKSWDYETIMGKIEHYKRVRQVKSPKGKSCGSVFKNEDYFAGKLIDEVGLKGFSVGGARVSNKHANYVLIEENATASDVYKLVACVKEKVRQATGVTLKEEIKFLGEFNAT